MDFPSPRDGKSVPDHMSHNRVGTPIHAGLFHHQATLYERVTQRGRVQARDAMHMRKHFRAAPGSRHRDRDKDFAELPRQPFNPLGTILPTVNLLRNVGIPLAVILIFASLLVTLAVAATRRFRSLRKTE